MLVSLKTGEIVKITPFAAITGNDNTADGNIKNLPTIVGKNLSLSIALRQVLSSVKNYTGILISAALLVFFLSLTGRMGIWLGADGKGMMDAFNPADHDIGVQLFGENDIDEAENIIHTYSGITAEYQLAMPNVSVNGTDMTCNVITEPLRFHILSGRTCSGSDEIVLTEFVAADMGVTVGDSVTVTGNKGSGEYTVSGIYSCANDMGKNVGMSRDGYLKISADNSNLWCHHYFLEDNSQKAVIAETLENRFGGDIHVHENTWPGLFGIISAMKILTAVMYAVTLAYIVTVTVTSANRLISSEKRDLGIYKALGMTSVRLRKSLAMRFVIVSAAGGLFGTAASMLFADRLVSKVMTLAGISNFSAEPDFIRLIFPSSAVVFMFALSVFIFSSKVKSLEVSSLISKV